MKKYLLLCASLCLALATFTSCGKDDEGTDMNITKEYFYGSWKCDTQKEFDAVTGEFIKDQPNELVYTFNANGELYMTNNVSYSDTATWSFDAVTYSLYLSDSHNTSVLFQVEVIDQMHVHLATIYDGTKYVLYLYKLSGESQD